MSSFKRDICSSKNKNMQRSFPKWTSPFININWIRIIRMTGIRLSRPNPITGVRIAIQPILLPNNNPTWHTGPGGTLKRGRKTGGKT